MFHLSQKEGLLSLVNLSRLTFIPEVNKMLAFGAANHGRDEGAFHCHTAGCAEFHHPSFELKGPHRVTIIDEETASQWELARRTPDRGAGHGLQRNAKYP